MAVYVAKALKHIGYDKHPIKIVFVGDEEADHVGNHANRIVIEESRGCQCAFNMETGDMENRLVVGRKSQHTFFVTVNGVGGHAGNDVLKAKNALLEAVYKIIDIAALTDMSVGTSVTPTIIEAGQQSSSIPDVCKFAVDIRFNTPEECQRVHEGIERILEKAYIPGTTTEFYVDVAQFEPYTESEEISKFHAFVNEIMRLTSNNVKHNMPLGA